MRFESAWCWLLLPPLIAYAIWLSRRSYAQLTTLARRVSLITRTLILLLLIAAVSRPVGLKSNSRHHSVFLLDTSRSISKANLDAALDDIDRLARESLRQHSGNTISLIAFGRDPEWLIRSVSEWNGVPQPIREKIHHADSLPTLYEERTRLVSADQQGSGDKLKDVDKRIADVEHFRNESIGEFTDLERALRLGMNCGNAEESRTLYVYTDANDNRGSWNRAWVSLSTSKTPAHTIVLDKPAPPEVVVSRIDTPSSVRVNQGFSADVHISSSTATTANLRVYKDGYVHQERAISLKPGSNAIHVEDLYFPEKGFHAIDAAIQVKDDTLVENNRARSILVVPGEARVLYVDRDMHQMSYLQDALELEGMKVDARSPTGLPQSITELLSFDAFILCNVPAERLSVPQMQMIRTYVRDFGGGFIMLGGDESFGLGGYYDTPIEEILPVRMPIQKDILRPSLALMLVIDKSGSMEGAKIQIAKRAALATAEAINPRDLIGLIGFDSEARTLLQLTPAADRATISSNVSALDAGGGTFLYPALQQAQTKLGESNARKKHVIVLSDGQTQGFGYEEFVQGMSADGISLSAIGIGEGADMRLLEGIASAGGGRAYFTNDFHSIPQIFTREALRASKSMLVERLVQPIANESDIALEGIDTEELPALTGYVAVTPRATAANLIISDTGDPILAKWRFGLGRTAAFTSEPKPHWAEDWVEWDDFAKFWSQLVRSVTGQDLGKSVQVELSHQREDANVKLRAEIQTADGSLPENLKLELAAVSADGRSQDLPITVSGPGTYEATVKDITFGEDQQFVWRVQSGEEQEQANSYGFVYSFSPEYAATTPSQETIEAIRALHTGEIMKLGESRLIPNTTVVKTSYTLWPILIAIALLLVPLDILIRRIL